MFRNTIESERSQACESTSRVIEAHRTATRRLTGVPLMAAKAFVMSSSDVSKNATNT